MTAVGYDVHEDLVGLAGEGSGCNVGEMTLAISLCSKVWPVSTWISAQRHENSKQIWRASRVDNIVARMMDF